MVSKMSQNKAIAEDFYEESGLWKQILNKNTKEFERHLKVRFVPLNKVHPNIPKPD